MAEKFKFFIIWFALLCGCAVLMIGGAMVLGPGLQEFNLGRIIGGGTMCFVGYLIAWHLDGCKGQSHPYL